jgi:hypothetical protein
MQGARRKKKPVRCHARAFFSVWRNRFYRLKVKRLLLKKVRPGTRYPTGQEVADLIDHLAGFVALGKAIPVKALPARALEKIADFEIEFVSFQWHGISSW